MWEKQIHTYIFRGILESFHKETKEAMQTRDISEPFPEDA